jgi:glutaredoxin-related protein
MSLSFTEIKDLIKNKKFNIFRRKKTVLKQYIENTVHDKSVYNSIRDMILINYLHYAPYCGFNGKMKATLKCHRKNKYNALDINLVHNKYPYDIRDDVIHMILWSAENLSIEQVDKILKKTLHNEFVYFINPQHLKSIPDVFHVHVFIKI